MKPWPKNKNDKNTCDNIFSKLNIKEFNIKMHCKIDVKLVFHEIL